MSEIPTPRIDPQLAELLDSEARRINSPEFIALDPVQFPRQFSRLQDIEIAALLASTIAWGNRTMICRNCSRMFALMDWMPYRYIMDKGYEELPEMNIHRTFFSKNLKHYLRGLHCIYIRHGSLHDFGRHHHIDSAPYPAWELAAAINRELTTANSGSCDSRCLPQNLDNTALKRLNMALRWLVRDDGIVDLGVWDVIKPSQLFIPLDVHVGNVSRNLGLLSRRSNDRKAVLELTATLKALRPDDPVFYDYALFGIGIESKKAE